MPSRDASQRSEKKRDRSVFDAVTWLDSQDAEAEKRKRRQTRRDELRRAAAVSQTKIFASLMECRILLQRAMQLGEAASGPSQLEKCNELLAQLLHARRALVSESVDDDDTNRNDYERLTHSDDSSKLQEQLQDEYQSRREQWKEVFNRRHKDVRLQAGLTAKAQFRVLDSSFWQQVEATVQHEEIRRHHDAAEAAVFDDTKLYQHLLQDFLVAASNHADAKLAQDRLESPSNRPPRKLVDRKATKGRKIRYHEIPKLVNFTFPLSRPQSQTVLDENEWFSSLFGGTRQSIS